MVFYVVYVWFNGVFKNIIIFFVKFVLFFLVVDEFFVEEGREWE